MEKYIVEVKDRETLYKAVIAPDGEPYITPAIGNVYTEPDTEAAYAHGYSNAEIKYRAEVKEAYQKGLSDAWEAARKIWQSDIYLSIFKVPMRMDCFIKFSASEAIEKIRQYEQGKEEIKVGDEVIPGYTITDPNPAIVTRKWKDNEGQDFVDTIGFNGNTLSFLESHVDKTGRHFHEIAEVLKKMREE